MTMNKLDDNSKDRDYFVLTPQIVWALCETPAEFTLWNVVKMIAGETGECWVGTNDLATLAMCSKPTVIAARKRLLEIGLLNGEMRKHNKHSDNAVWHLSIPNLWKQNIEWRDEHNKLKGTDGRIEFKEQQKAARKALNTQVSTDEIVPLGGGQNIDKGGGQNIDQGVVNILTRGSKKIDREEEPAKKNHFKKNHETNKGDMRNISQSKSEPVRENLDPYGDEIPRNYNKYDPLFQEIRMRLFGTPSNLQGQERVMWEQLLRRIVADRGFIDWMRWQSENNSNGKTFKFFYTAVMNETHYAQWQAGEFVSKSELPDVLKMRRSAPKRYSPLDEIIDAQAGGDDAIEVFNSI